MEFKSTSLWIISFLQLRGRRFYLYILYVLAIAFRIIQNVIGGFSLNTFHTISVPPWGCWGQLSYQLVVKYNGFYSRHPQVPFPSLYQSLPGLHFSSESCSNCCWPSAFPVTLVLSTWVLSTDTTWLVTTSVSSESCSNCCWPSAFPVTYFSMLNEVLLVLLYT